MNLNYSCFLLYFFLKKYSGHFIIVLNHAFVFLGIVIFFLLFWFCSFTHLSIHTISMSHWIMFVFNCYIFQECYKSFRRTTMCMLMLNIIFLNSSVLFYFLFSTKSLQVFFIKSVCSTIFQFCQLFLKLLDKHPGNDCFAELLEGLYVFCCFNQQFSCQMFLRIKVCKQLLLLRKSFAD